MTNHGVYNFMDGYIKAYVEDYQRGTIPSRDLLTNMMKGDKLVSSFIDNDFIEYITRKVEEKRA